MCRVLDSFLESYLSKLVGFVFYSEERKPAVLLEYNNAMTALVLCKFLSELNNLVHLK